MPNYRRDHSGSVWFFTVVTHAREPLFRNTVARLSLVHALRETNERYPFEIAAWVLLPDHIHAVWLLPEDDLDYSRRWSLLKRRFTQLYRVHGGHGPPYWQKRFWAHRIEDDADYAHHVDYVHINPLKHGLRCRVADWPWSTFHRYVKHGLYPADWGGSDLPDGIGNE